MGLSPAAHLLRLLRGLDVQHALDELVHAQHPAQGRRWRARAERMPWPLVFGHVTATTHWPANQLHVLPVSGSL